MTTKTLKVLLFSHSAESTGGAERSLLELVRELVNDHGTECLVAVPKEGGELPRELRRVGAKVIPLDYGFWATTKDFRRAEMDARVAAGLDAVRKACAGTISRFDPDVVLTNTISIPWGAAAAAILGKPHAWFVREFGDDYHYHLPKPGIFRFVESASNIVFANSRAILREHFPRLPRSRAAVAYTHVDPRRLHRSGPSSGVFTRPGALRLISVGRISEFKGQADALRALRLLTRRGVDAELALVGTVASAFAPTLMSFYEDPLVGERICVVSHMENPYPLVRRADAVLVCTKREAQGQATMEAMLLGKAVVGTDAGGTAEFIQAGRTGLLYPPGDHAALARALMRLARSPGLRRRLGSAARRWAAGRFTREAYGGAVHARLLALKGLANPLPESAAASLAAGRISGFRAAA